MTEIAVPSSVQKKKNSSVDKIMNHKLCRSSIIIIEFFPSQVGQEIEVRPGIVSKTQDGKIQCIPIKSRIVSLFTELNELQYAVPGGLIGAWVGGSCNVVLCKHTDFDLYDVGILTLGCSLLVLCMGGFPMVVIPQIWVFKCLNPRCTYKIDHTHISKDSVCTLVHTAATSQNNHTS